MSEEYGAEHEGKLNDQVSRGHEAQTILDHPIVVDSFAKVRARIAREFEDCRPEDTAKLLRCKITLDVLKCVEGEIRHIKQTGEQAKAELGVIERIRDRIKLKGWRDH